MCRSMVDIHSATAEIKKKKQDKNIMSAFATQGGHNKSIVIITLLTVEKETQIFKSSTQSCYDLRKIETQICT